jgi:hypothetical protein
MIGFRHIPQGGYLEVYMPPCRWKSDEKQMTRGIHESQVA